MAMRIYTTFAEMLNETKRELKEMGVVVHTKSVQDLDISNNPDYDSYELQSYQYCVTQPDYRTIPLKCLEWAEAEFHERIHKPGLNPGEAWKLRKDYWSKFIHRGKFDYTYSRRFESGLPRVINALKKDKFTRRAFLPMFISVIDYQDNF